MIDFDPVRLGILSTARINRLVIPAAQASPAVELVAVASRDAARAQEYATQWRIPRAHGSYEALLADDSVEAVYVPLPNSLHHAWTMKALAAGKHVLCEKPYSRRPAEVDEAFGAAEQAGLILTEAFMWRYNPQTSRFLELLAGIGELQLVRATFSFRLHDPTNVRLLPELDGGSLMDVGCYCVSGARLLAGAEPVRVDAVQVVGPTGVDVRLAATLTFPGDVVGQIMCAFTNEHMSLEAIGSEGSIVASDPWHARTPTLVWNGQELRLDPVDSYERELESFAAAIRGRGTPLLGRADALGQARTIEALYRSAATRQPVEL